MPVRLRSSHLDADTLTEEVALELSECDNNGTPARSCIPAALWRKQPQRNLVSALVLFKLVNSYFTGSLKVDLRRIRHAYVYGFMASPCIVPTFLSAPVSSSLS
jgi:hypothetical protein